MKKFNIYKIWLFSSAASVIVAVALTALYILSAPKDCPACGLAAVGLVPFWLLAFLTLLINLIAIPVYLKRNPHDLPRNLVLGSWLLFALAVITVLAVALLTWLEA